MLVSDVFWMVKTMVWCGRGCQNHSFSGTLIFSIALFHIVFEPKLIPNAFWKPYMVILALLLRKADSMLFLSSPRQDQESW